MTAGRIGEDGLIRRIAGWLGAQGRPRGLIRGIGDDAATVRTGSRTVVTTDAFIEGVHFRHGWGRPWQFGWKALAANVSDLAAVGGAPGAAVISLALPPDTAVAWLREFYAGLVACGRAHGIALAGGNLARAREFGCHITALGAAPARVIGRTGARPGDLIAVTGSLGGSAAGLGALRRGWTDAPARAAIFRHLVPRPRVVAGRALARIASAMLDVSDGLARDARRMAEASGVRVVIIPGAIPIHPAAEVLAGRLRTRPAALALGSGEEYELLAAVPRNRWQAAVRAAGKTGIALTAIGECRRGKGTSIAGGLRAGGWDHFSVRT